MKNGDDDDEDEEGDEERNDEGEEDESGEGGRGKERAKEREREREGERSNGRDEDTDMVSQHLCSCANHSRDHNRLPVPRSKQALSRRLQAEHLQKKLVRRLDSLVRVSRRVERDQKKTHARELVIASGAQNGRLWRVRTPSFCG